MLPLDDRVVVIPWRLCLCKVQILPVVSPEFQAVLKYFVDVGCDFRAEKEVSLRDGCAEFDKIIDTRPQLRSDGSENSLDFFIDTKPALIPVHDKFLTIGFQLLPRYIYGHDRDEWR